MTAEETLAAAICEALEGGGSTDDALAALTNLQDLVVSERERADKTEQERDEALQAARDGGWEMSSEEEVRHLAGMLESQNLMTVEAEARAERAETALRLDAQVNRARIADLEQAVREREAALSGLADDTQEQGAWEGYDGGRTCGQEGWHYYEDGLAACRCGLLRGQRDEGTA